MDAKQTYLEHENERLQDDVNAKMTAYTVQRNRANWHKERYKNLEAEVARLTKALVECQEAFDSGVEQ